MISKNIMKTLEKTYTQSEVIELIYAVLKATGLEIKTTMRDINSPRGPYVEFDGTDLKNWIKKNVNGTQD